MINIGNSVWRADQIAMIELKDTQILVLHIKGTLINHDFINSGVAELEYKTVIRAWKVENER